MGKAAKIIIAIIVVAAIAIAVVVIATSGSDEANDNNKTNKQPASQKTGTPDTAKPSGDKAAAVAAVITYNGEGFDPETTNIKAGQAITVTNSSQSQLEFVSDPHPTHTDNPELNAGDIGPGESKTFTVTKKGSWGFHNHLNSSQHGKIIVQ